MSPEASGPARRERLRHARLYFVCEARPDVEHLLAGALAGGADMIQLRDKDASDGELLSAAATFRAAADRHGALFVLNDRPDLALAARADGVHVGQDDAPPEAVRAEVGPDLLIGLSTHAPEQLREGMASAADYLSVGPVHATPTKEGRPATGLEYVREAAARGAGKPWFAIGGIDLETIGEIVGAGAERAVVVRAIRDAEDPGAVAARLRGALQRGTVGAAA